MLLQARATITRGIHPVWQLHWLVPEKYYLKGNEEKRDKILWNNYLWRCHGGSEENSHKSGVHIKLSWIETPERQSNYLIDLEHPLNDQVFDTYTTLKLNAQRQSSV